MKLFYKLQRLRRFLSWRPPRFPARYLRAEQAAEFLGTTANTLGVWRCKRTVQIPYIKVGKSVKYRLSELKAFLAKNTVPATTGEEEQPARQTRRAKARA